MVQKKKTNNKIKPKNDRSKDNSLNNNYKSKKKNDKNKFKKIKRTYEVELVLLISLVIIFILSLHTSSVGIGGKFIKNISFGLFSKGGYLLPYVLFILIFLKLNKNFESIRRRYLISKVLLFISINIMYSISHFNIINLMYSDANLKLLSIEGIKIAFKNGILFKGGGVVNNSISIFLYSSLGKYGLLIVTITSFVIGVILLVNLKFKDIFKRESIITRSKKDKKVEKKTRIQKSKPISKDYFENKKEIKIYNYSDFNDESNEKIDDFNKLNKKLDITTQSKIENYSKPRYTFLNKPKNRKDQLNKSDIIQKAEILERTLNNFGIEAKVIEINRGPTITRYEIQPKPGTKISKIVNLSDDIALNLAVSQVRVAPVPNKVAVGIEVPNEENSMVKLREILESDEFKKSKSKLSIALGKNISGKPVVADLKEMPHLLIAGATGSGKSVCVNTIIASILFNATPDEVKLLMIDPKVVELNIYNGIPHLILPVVTDPKKASIALGWAVNEMTKRYDLFANNQVRDIDNYNKKADNEPLPKIVIVIDELADLMMIAPNQVEDSIARLAQMARAAGIHLIVATQRPSVDVITGIIKANITSRIAFSVSSQVDSRTILDIGGAEKLLGKGDMLFNPVGAAKPIRLQGAFISEDEIGRIVDHIKSQVSDVKYNEDILKEAEQISMQINSDKLMPEIIRFLANQKTISISMLQRKFRIGYNRAARIVDELEENGLVGPSQGSKPRNVIITIEKLEKNL